MHRITTIVTEIQKQPDAMLHMQIVYAYIICCVVFRPPLLCDMGTRFLSHACGGALRWLAFTSCAQLMLRHWSFCCDPLTHIWRSARRYSPTAKYARGTWPRIWNTQHVSHNSHKNEHSGASHPPRMQMHNAIVMMYETELCAIVRTQCEYFRIALISGVMMTLGVWFAAVRSNFCTLVT